MNTNVWLRIEAASELLVACWFYRQTCVSWWLFALLFFTPDIGMLGYMVNPRIGAWSYNILHTYTVPILLAATGWHFSHQAALAVSFTWCAHIAFDRMMGYGLKYPEAFQSTHLGNLGPTDKTQV